MKIVKTSSGKKIKLSKKEWTQIGKKASWIMKTAGIEGSDDGYSKLIEKQIQNIEEVFGFVKQQLVIIKGLEREILDIAYNSHAKPGEDYYGGDYLSQTLAAVKDSIYPSLKERLENIEMDTIDDLYNTVKNYKYALIQILRDIKNS